jgi:hypothetical protein
MPALNANRPWTAADDTMLRKLIRENTPTRVIAMKTGSTESSIYARACQLRLSLKPVNQSPYYRRTKS